MIHKDLGGLKAANCGSWAKLKVNMDDAGPGGRRGGATEARPYQERPDGLDRGEIE